MSGPQGQVRAIPDAEERLDEGQDDSQPTACKTDVFSCGYLLMRVSAAVSSITLVSSKRSANVTGIDTSAEASGSKRQRAQKDSGRKTTQSLAIQDAVYAAEKFSNSFIISHVLNLLVESEHAVPIHSSTI